MTDEQWGVSSSLPGGQLSGPPGLPRLAALVALLLFVAFTGLATILFLYRDRGGAFSDFHLSNYFAFYQDLPVAPLFIAFLLAAALIKSPASLRLPRIELTNRAALLIAGLVVLGCYAGTHIIFGRYALSLDEFMAEFDSRIFRGGSLFAPVAAGWHGLMDALQPIFLLKTPDGSSWSSVYLPGNAALRAAFDLLGDAALTGPALAGASVVLLFFVARKLRPDDGEFAAIAVLLLITSSQFLLTAMTPYAMTAHLALNLGWLLLALHDRPWSRACAIALSFLAGGLHQMVFHPLFVVPFLAWFWIQGRRRLVLLYLVALGLISLFWIGYWSIALSLTFPQGVASSQLGGSFFLERAQAALRSASQTISRVYNLDNGLRLLSWQNPITLILVSAAILTWRRQVSFARTLALGIVLMIGVLLVIMPFQGHGWGYRYLHGYLGSFALLGAFGWVAIRGQLSGQGRIFHRALILSVPFSLLILLPIRAYQASAFAKPYRQADRAMSRSMADILIIDTAGRWYSQDLVRNDPYLRNRPIRLSAGHLSAGDFARLCARYKVELVTRSSPELATLRAVESSRVDRLATARLNRARAAGCTSSQDGLRQPMSSPRPIG